MVYLMASALAQKMRAALARQSQAEDQILQLQENARYPVENHLLSPAALASALGSAHTTWALPEPPMARQA
jgi:hypothetical protein